MSSPTRPIPPGQDRRFGRAVCERLGIDPAIVGDDLRWQVIGGEELGRITLTAYLRADEILAMFNAAGDQAVDHD